MVHSSDRICIQENDETDGVCVECAKENPCYTAQPMDESSLLVDKTQEIRDKIKPFVMFIK